MDCITKAAKECFVRPLKGRKKEDVPEQTKELLQKREEHRERGEEEEYKAITHQLKETTKEERRRELQEKLAEMEWVTVKALRKTGRPKFNKIRDLQGNVVPDAKIADTFAEYLEKRQWKKPQNVEGQEGGQIIDQQIDQNTIDQQIGRAQPQEGIPIDQQIDEQIDEAQEAEEERKISMEELKAALARAKNNKAPGPDGVTIEMIRHLNEQHLQLILDICNDCWEKEKLQEFMNTAEVVEIFKKGRSDLPENYAVTVVL